MSSGVLADNLIHFVRYLRLHGLDVVPDTTGDLARAAMIVGLEDEDDVRSAFAALCVARPEHREIFDTAFALFFGGTAPPSPGSLDHLEIKIHERDVLRGVVPVISQRAGGTERPASVNVEAGASAVERLSRRDFGDLTPEEREAVRRLIAAMVWQPADAWSRRHRPARRGRRPHLRRTLRNLIGPSGDLMPLAMSARKRRTRPLIVLADVSGSMERYAEMFLYFIHAAQGRLGRVEAFVFSTHLTRITREIRHRDPGMSLQRVAAAVTDWSGGTKIGDALHAFNWEWSRRVTAGGPIAIIISDGWDRGDPDLLRREMGRLARSVHRVVWLNPLAGRPGFSPETRGMRAALPHVDHLLSAANVADLSVMVKLLESVPAQRSAPLRLGAVTR